MKNNIIILILILIFQISCDKREDMSSFILMNSKVEESIEITGIANSTMLDIIYSKAKSNDDFVSYKESAEKVHGISTIFNKYITDLKSVIKEKNTTKFVDEYFFNSGETASGGEEFLNYIESYKSSLISTIVLSNPDIAGMVKSTFDIGSIEDRRGVQTNWLTLNYKGFPAIASIIKLSEMQANVKRIEKSFLESILNVKLERMDSGKSELMDKNSVAANIDIDKNIDTVNIEKKKSEVKTKIIPKVKITPKKGVIKPAKTDAGTIKEHTVGKEDTLYSISKKYGITTSQLKKMNGMTNNVLVLGQKLKVKQ